MGTRTSDESVSSAGRFAAFYAAEVSWARRLARVLVADRHTAEDLTHDAFIALEGRFDQLTNPRGYLRTVLVNASRRYWLQERRRREADHALASSEAVSPEAREVLDLVDRLPGRQRDVLILRYFEGLSEAETAETLGCRVGTVKSAHARAIARLRKELQ